MPDHEPMPETPPGSPRSKSAENGPEKFGQFKISTLLSCTAIVCFLIAWMRVDTMFQNIDPELPGPGFFSGLLVFAIFFAPPFTCIPYLIDRMLLKKNGLNFNLFWCIWLTICVGIYSMLMLMLATTAFTTDWKGGKGMHWIYYTLDTGAGLTLWPIYALGIGLFIAALFNPRKAKRNPMFLIGVATCAAISIWYTMATLCLNFTESSGADNVFTIVPGACGVCYSIYAALIWRNGEFAGSLARYWNWIVSWFTGLLISILIKYPLAVQIYEALPDDPPEDCFVVTAATRGHRHVVGSWHDAEQQRLLNRQLLTFWRFESRLRTSLPNTHRMIRAVYNRVGPVVARTIVFRWQADLVYLLLKPLEFVARNLELLRW